ncbi:MAG: putative oxidoreductase [Thermoleophilaceae bacterium]|jgi:putative oxidoreductase|nr:putative oxidoreductase [Thermoleophilaceae bacterium]
MKLGSAAIRGVVGPLFIGHGTQKLFGWFGGHGIEATGGYFESLGMKPGKRHATAAGVAETLGGALLALGFLTPVAATLVSGTMVTAIRKAHAQNGPWVTNGGYEYNLVLLASMIALTESGPGPLSLDGAVATDLKGTRWALLQLGAAVAGSYLADLPPLNEADGQGSAEAEAGAGDPASNGHSSADHARAGVSAN